MMSFYLLALSQWLREDENVMLNQGVVGPYPFIHLIIFINSKVLWGIERSGKLSGGIYIVFEETEK